MALSYALDRSSLLTQRVMCNNLPVNLFTRSHQKKPPILNRTPCGRGSAQRRRYRGARSGSSLKEMPIYDSYDLRVMFVSTRLCAI